jgi:hypothetical protein
MESKTQLRSYCKNIIYNQLGLWVQYIAKLLIACFSDYKQGILFHSFSTLSNVLIKHPILND